MKKNNYEEYDSYMEFAYVYDELMDNVPYDKWASRIHEIIKEYGVSVPEGHCEEDCDLEDESVINNLTAMDLRENYDDTDYDEDVLASERNLVLDLGCGTGTLTELLYDIGYDMIGVDLSEDMLQVARDKSYSEGKSILYLLQDMRELDLYSTIGTVISVCDSINYLTDPADVLKVMKLVNNYLYPDGLFIFDFNTVHKYADIIGERTIAENRDDVSFIWDNYYDAETKINEYDLTIYTLAEESDIYRRFSETHFQRGYTLNEMKGMAEEAGLEIIKCFDSDNESEPDDMSERICMVCKKK